MSDGEDGGHGRSTTQRGVHQTLRWRIWNDSGGNRAASPHHVTGKGTMRSATKRTLIVAAGLTAAALFGSLTYHGSSQAQGSPAQHHDVALIDLTDATL